MLRNKYKFICVHCGVENKCNQPNQKLCSIDCRKKYFGREATLGIASASVGSIAEMMVCCEMLKRGYSAFITVSQSSFCDVVAIKKDEILMIEVRTAYLSTYGKLSYPKILHNQIATPTHYGLYLAKTGEIILIEITEQDRLKYSTVK